MCVGRNTENDKFEFDNLLVVLVVTIDDKLIFDIHIRRRADQKLGALLRITNYLNSSKKN